MKFITCASAPAAMGRAAFQDWFVAEHVPAILKNAPGLAGGLVRRRIDAPKGSMIPDTPDAAAGDFTPYDVVMETWARSNEDFRREVLPTEKRLRDIGSRHITYVVDPRVHKDSRVAEAGRAGKRPELTMIIALKWKPGVTNEFAFSEYMNHAPLALRCQPAMTRYEQNYVTEVVSWSPDASPVNVLSDFAFATAADFVARYRVTEEELQDTATFVGGFHLAFLGDAEPFKA